MLVERVLLDEQSEEVIKEWWVKVKAVV